MLLVLVEHYLDVFAVFGIVFPEAARHACWIFSNIYSRGMSFFLFCVSNSGAKNSPVHLSAPSVSYRHCVQADLGHLRL